MNSKIWWLGICIGYIPFTDTFLSQVSSLARPRVRFELIGLELEAISD